MSEIKDKIQEINKAAKTSRRINNILWLCVVGLVALAFYLAYVAIDAREIADIEKTKAENLAKRNDTLRQNAEKSKQELLDNINKSREILWQNAQSINTEDSYSYYVAIYGKEDEHFGEVESAMGTLFEDEGYVQILDSDGKTKYFEEKPASELGRFFVAVSGRNVNTGVLGHADFPNARDKTNHSIQQNQTVKLIEEFNSGDAVWAKIGYTNL